MPADELAKGEKSVPQSRIMTPPAKSVIASQPASENRKAKIQAEDIWSTRSSMSGTLDIFDHAHSYLGYRPVPTQTEDRDAPYTSDVSREEIPVRK